MSKLSSLFCLLLVSVQLLAQNWTWTELDTLPFRTANNAVCEAEVNGQEFVYSFGGIDTSKIYSGIHKRSFKYDVANGNWSEIAPLPDNDPKIASGASFVKGKIYVIGGYHVYQNGTEVSSEKVHVYNPSTDTYEADGAVIPTPIDDHVQCVYKDSLIYVVTGWSNTANFPNVQIYDPTLDQWQLGTFVPTTFQYTAFGASGYIIGDTIYYHGGAAGGSFAARKFIRKGYINPNDPTDITWELMGEAPGDAGYRSACSGTDDRIFWVGGSAISYNYDGIAYNGSGGVDPSARILHFNPTDSIYLDETSQPYGVMDLRGIAKLSNNRWIICGGMDTNQVVSNRTFLLQSNSLGITDPVINKYALKYAAGSVQIELNSPSDIRLINTKGQVLEIQKGTETMKVEYGSFPAGIYFFQWENAVCRIRLN